ncbi:MAG: hypothetical protein ABJC89_07370 [Acidobacteriota bacterium]
MTPRGWLLLLCVDLLLGEPVKLAREVTATLGSLGMRGSPAVVELGVHAAIAAVAVAAGWALSIGNPGAPGFAAVAILVSAAASVQSLYWSVLPSSTMPGDRLPLALAAIAHAAGWMVYLRRSRRVRALYG